MNGKRATIRLALAATMLAAGFAAGASAQTVVKIGIVNSFSGFLAAPGDEMQKGMDLYAKEHTKDLSEGVRIEVIKRDDGTNPEVGKRVAQELITRDKVNILLGVMGSPIAAAIAPLTAEAKIPLILTTAAGVAIPRISPYVARVSFTQWQTAVPLGKWAAQQGWKKAVTAVSDFIPGHDAEAAFNKGYGDAGGQVVNAIRFPTNNPDFAPFVQKAKDANPGVVFFFGAGGPRAPRHDQGNQGSRPPRSRHQRGLDSGPRPRRGAAQHGRRAGRPRHRRQLFHR